MVTWYLYSLLGSRPATVKPSDGDSSQSSKRDTTRQTRSASPLPLAPASGAEGSGKGFDPEVSQEKHTGSSKLFSVFRKTKQKKPGSSNSAHAKEVPVESQKLAKKQDKPTTIVEARVEENSERPRRKVADQVQLFNKKDSAVIPEEKVTLTSASERRETRSASPADLKSPKKSEAKLDQDEEKASPSKWSIFRAKFHRSRSLSPEPTSEENKTPEVQVNGKHPLEATNISTRENVGTETSSEDKGKVTDRIKLYNERNEDLRNEQSAKKSKDKSSTVDSTSMENDVKRKEKGKERSRDKVSTSEGSKDAKGDRNNPQKTAKKESKSWNPFKRIGRRDSGADLLDSDDKGALGVDEDRVEELTEQEVASTSDNDAVKLLSVTPRTEKKLDGDSSPNEGNASGGEDQPDFGGPGPEIRLPSSGSVPVGDNVASASSNGGQEPVVSGVSVRDQVQKMQVSAHTSPFTVRRSLSHSSHLRYVAVLVLMVGIR